MDIKNQPESEVTKFDAQFLAQEVKRKHKLLKTAKGNAPEIKIILGIVSLGILGLAWMTWIKILSMEVYLTSIGVFLLVTIFHSILKQQINALIELIGEDELLKIKK